MKLSKQSLEILLDLVEIKLSTMQVHDREDARELVRLRNCRDEIMNEYNRRGKKVMIEENPTPKPEKRQTPLKQNNPHEGIDLLNALLRQR